MMNRRLFLGKASALTTLALPAVGLGAVVAVTADTTAEKQPTLILSYTKQNASQFEDAEPDFSWAKMDEYIAIENQFFKDGSLKSVKRSKRGATTDIHLAFRDSDALNRYFTVLAKVASPQARAAAGFDLQIRIV